MPESRSNAKLVVKVAGQDKSNDIDRDLLEATAHTDFHQPGMFTLRLADDPPQGEAFSWIDT